MLRLLHLNEERLITEEALTNKGKVALKAHIVKFDKNITSKDALKFWKVFIQGPKFQSLRFRRILYGIEELRKIEFF